MCVIDLVFSDIHSYVFCVFASHPFLFKYILYHKTSPPFPHNPITIHTRWQDGDWFYLSPSQLTCGQGATVATVLGSRSTIEWLDLSREKKMGQGWKKEPRQPISTWIATKGRGGACPPTFSHLLNPGKVDQHPIMCGSELADESSCKISLKDVLPITGGCSYWHQRLCTSIL